MSSPTEISNCPSNVLAKSLSMLVALLKKKYEFMCYYRDIIYLHTSYLKTFCHWRTKLRNKGIDKGKKNLVHSYGNYTMPVSCGILNPEKSTPGSI